MTTESSVFLMALAVACGALGTWGFARYKSGIERDLSLITMTVSFINVALLVLIIHL